MNQTQNEEEFKHHVWRLDVEIYKKPVSHEMFVQNFKPWMLALSTGDGQ